MQTNHTASSKSEANSAASIVSANHKRKDRHRRSFLLETCGLFVMLGGNESRLLQGFRLAVKTLARRRSGGSLTLAEHSDIYSVVQSQKGCTAARCILFLVPRRSTPRGIETPGRNASAYFFCAARYAFRPVSYRLFPSLSITTTTGKSSTSRRRMASAPRSS